MKNFNLKICYLIFLPLIFISCLSKSQVSTKGIVQKITHLYNGDGKPTFTHYLKVWFKDSIAIEEITGVNTVTRNDTVISITYPLQFCRYVNLKTKTLYDYKHFSDTAKIFHKAALPDSLWTDAGWSFYTDKAPVIKDTPAPLCDTMVANVLYKRAKFCFSWHDPQKDYIIGYFRYDLENRMFSLENAYCRKSNCTLMKYYNYRTGMSKPFGSKEIVYLSDALSKEQLNVFAAWEKNEKENPVEK